MKELLQIYRHALNAIQFAKNAQKVRPNARVVIQTIYSKTLIVWKLAQLGITFKIASAWNALEKIIAKLVNFSNCLKV